MEDDVEETASQLTVSETDTGENTPRIRTRPRNQTPGSVHNALVPLVPLPRSLYRAQAMRRLPSAMSGSIANSQVRLHDSIFFPGGESGFGAGVSPASERSDREKEQDERKWREREEERRRVEMQIGQRLRVIGDHFQRERMHRFMRYRREWEEICWHIATMLLMFLYPREFIGN